MEQQMTLKNGSAAAAILAAGIGSAALGFVTTLAEAMSTFKNAIILYAPVGPLSGKTTIAVVVWLVAWFILNARWKDKDIDFGKTFTATIVLIALGVIGTFPLFYDLFVK